MAFIGMRYVVAAELNAHTPGAAPTYKAGMVIGKAISGNLTITRNDNPLYADDAIAEDDRSITGMSLELGLDDLLEPAAAYLGLVKANGTGDSLVYYDTSASPKNVGVGYIRVRRKNGADVFQAVWMYKAMFSQESEKAQTKGESIEWQTPTINGRAAALDIDGTGDLVFRVKKNFDTFDDAQDYLDGLAGIT